MKKNNVLLSTSISICFVFILSFLAILPFFHSGFFPIHDDAQVARVYEMHKSLADGMFPVRWVADLGYGYGYPIFNFYAPLAYYIGGATSFLGLNFVLATKIMMIFGILLSGITMFLLANRLWGRYGGIISALFYIYAPYHALNIYVRGAVGEYYAYAFVPLAVYGFLQIFTTNSWWYVIVASIGYGGIILSHNLTAFMVTPFLFLWILVLLILHYKKTKKIHKKLICGVLLGIGIAAFYWLPVIFEMKYTDVLSQVGGGSDFHDHFICLSQLWDSPWGYAGSAPGCLYDGMSFRIGKIHVVFIALIALLFPFVWKKDKKLFRILLGLFLALIISLILTLEVSLPIWESIRLFAFFQFPWRFLVLVSFFASLLAGAIILYIQYFISDKKMNEIISIIFTCVISLILLVYYTKIFIPQTYTNKEYLTSYNLQWVASKTSDEYLPKNFPIPKTVTGLPSRVVSISPKGTVKNINKKTQEITGELQLLTASNVQFHIAYFPSWKLFIDDKEVAYMVKNGQILVLLPKGQYQFRLEFVSTPVQKAANVISLLSICILIGGLVYTKRIHI